MKEVQTIQGGVASDDRGQIRFVNDFDMSLVKRFYIIKNVDTELVRGWRAHRLEQRWFYVLSGSFVIDLVKIDDWDQVSSSLPVQRVLLEASSMQILHLPKGYGTAFQAKDINSELLVYSDFGIENAQYDDHVFPLDYFENRIMN